MRRKTPKTISKTRNDKNIAVAQKILGTLVSCNRNIIEFRKLAKESGFGSVNSRAFKQGFDLLERNHIVKRVQSGWSSERRDTRHAPRVILLSDIYTLEHRDVSLVKTPEQKVVHKEVKDARTPKRNLKSLNRFLHKIADCKDCKTSPVVYVTDKRIPLCKKHWRKLAYSRVQW